MCLALGSLPVCFSSLDELAEKIPELLKAVHDNMYDKALERREAMTHSVTTLAELEELADRNETGFIKAMWCGELECEEKLKEVCGVTSRCIPFEQETLSDACVCCGKKAKAMVYWGKAY